MNEWTTCNGMRCAHELCLLRDQVCSSDLPLFASAHTMIMPTALPIMIHQ